MDRAELLKRLKEERIRPAAYDLNGDARAETYVLRQCPEGWEAFYSERGLKTGRHMFADEDEACTFFLNLLSNDPTTREG